MGGAGVCLDEAEEEGFDDSWALLFAEVEGGGRRPPERKEGQRDRSSGNDVPPLAEGEMWERMAAA